MAKIINYDFRNKEQEGSYTTDEAISIIKRVDTNLKLVFDDVKKLNSNVVVLNMISKSFVKIVSNLIEIAKQAN